MTIAIGVGIVFTVLVCVIILIAPIIANAAKKGQVD